MHTITFCNTLVQLAFLALSVQCLPLASNSGMVPTRTVAPVAPSTGVSAMSTSTRTMTVTRTLVVISPTPAKTISSTIYHPTGHPSSITATPKPTCECEEEGSDDDTTSESDSDEGTTSEVDSDEDNTASEADADDDTISESNSEEDTTSELDSEEEE